MLLMPKKLHGKKLSAKEHRIWRKAHAASKGKARSPGAVATAAVKKHRRKKGKK